MSAFIAQDFANTAWAFAWADQADASQCAGLAGAARLHRCVRCTDLANTAGAVAWADQTDASHCAGLAGAARIA